MRPNHKARNMAIVLGSVLAVIALGVVALSQNGIASGSQLTYLKIGPSTQVLGSKDAPVSIFEFGDFQCPSCGYWFKTQEQHVVHNLVDTGKAKLVWRDFIIYGPDSRLAARAAYAAGEQGKFWQFHDLLYTNQGDPRSGWASSSNLIRFAQQLGLNMTQFTQSFNSSKYDSLIDGNFQAGQQLGANGTPTFILLGPDGKTVKIEGPQPYSSFESAANSVLG